MVPDETSTGTNPGRPAATGTQTGRTSQPTGTQTRAGQAPAMNVNTGQEIGFTPPVVLALAAGVALAVIGGLFGTVAATTDGGSAGLVKASWWFMWLGRVAVSASLVGAGLLGTRATGGMRAAFVITGAVLLFSGGAVTTLMGTFGI